MIECDKFHEKKRERKFYEDKKQKALSSIDDMITDINLAYELKGKGIRRHWQSEIHKIKKLVNDI